MDGKKASDWLDRERSADLAGKVAARDKECFRNAVMALGALGREENADYVEGWATTPWMATLHGWVELEDGTIIDSTPTWLEADDDRLYFAGRRYSRADIWGSMEDGETALPLDEYLRMEMIPADLRDTYFAATEAVYGPEAVEFMKNPTLTKEAS